MKYNYDIHVPFSTYIVKQFQIKAKVRSVVRHNFRTISPEEINNNRCKSYEYLKF